MWTPTDQRSQPVRRRSRAMWTARSVAVLWLIAFLYGVMIGRHQLASWLYDTPVPTRDQLRTARALVALPIGLPFFGLFGLVWWRERNSIRNALRSAQYRPKFVDPSRESRLQIEEPGGGPTA